MIWQQIRFYARQVPLNRPANHENATKVMGKVAEIDKDPLDDERIQRRKFIDFSRDQNIFEILIDFVFAKLPSHDDVIVSSRPKAPTLHVLYHNFCTITGPRWWSRKNRENFLSLTQSRLWDEIARYCQHMLLCSLASCQSWWVRHLKYLIPASCDFFTKIYCYCVIRLRKIVYHMTQKQWATESDESKRFKSKSFLSRTRFELF